MPTYYINADTGNDTTGDGSSGNPWLTISKAHTSATSGDTIICQDSTATYTFANQIFTKNLTIQGEQDDASGAVFDGGGFDRYWEISVDVTIEKITVQNISKASNRGLFHSLPDNVTFTVENCIFKTLTLRASSTNGGFVSSGNSSPTLVSFTNCVFDDFNFDAATGGYVFVSYNWNGAGDIEINQCTFVFNNAANPPDYVIRSSSGYTATIKNCIFYNNTGTTINYENESSTVSATYNAFYNITGFPSGTGNITSDPLFVDAANGDFRLQRDSPAIATGVLV